MDGPGNGRPAVIGTALVVAASLAAAGCSGSSSPAAPSCFGKPAAAGTRPGPAGTSSGQAHRTAVGAGTKSHPPGGGIAAGWTLPGANLQNTRDVASQITSTNVSKLGVAWTVPIRPDISHLDYASTPVVVNGVVYTQDMKSDVLAIELHQ